MPYTVEKADAKAHRFTPDEAHAFLASWYRIKDADGSTVAYCPDRVTADRIAGLPGLIEAGRNTVARLTEGSEDVDVREELEAALRACGEEV